MWIVSGKTELCPFRVRSHSYQRKTVLGQYGRKCLEFFTRDHYTWEQGESVCNSGGGHLASIETADEQKYVHSLIHSANRYSSVWLGLNDLLVEGIYRWTTGK